jgi:hypothetical protein
LEIEIERPSALQKDTPSPVFIKLLNENKELIGSVSVFPRWYPSGKPDKPSHFQVEVHKGGTVSPEVDIRLKI